MTQGSVSHAAVDVGDEGGGKDEMIRTGAAGKRVVAGTSIHPVAGRAAGEAIEAGPAEGGPEPRR